MKTNYKYLFLIVPIILIGFSKVSYGALVLSTTTLSNVSNCDPNAVASNSTSSCGITVSGTDRGLIFGIAHTVSGGIDQVTFNGDLMTAEVSNFALDGSIGGYISLYKLANPDNASANIVISRSSGSYYAMSAWAYTGANQSALIDNTSSTTRTAVSTSTWSAGVSASVDDTLVGFLELDTSTGTHVAGDNTSVQASYPAVQGSAGNTPSTQGASGIKNVSVAVSGNGHVFSSVVFSVLPLSSSPPIISNVSSTAATSTALISFNTDISATSSIAYGTSTAYGSVVSTSTSGTFFPFLLTGLSTSTTYHYQVSATANDLTSTSSDQTFLTGSGSTSTFAQINYPADSSQVDSTFLNWFVSFNLTEPNNVNATHPGIIEVRHGMSPTNLNIIDNRYFYDQSTSSSDPQGVGIGHSNNDNATTTWYAKFILYDYATSTYYGNVITSSTVISYSINSVNEPNVMECTPAEDWTDIGGGLRYGLCSAGIFLFYPSEESMTNLGDKFSSFQDVFPFNLYFGIAEQFATSTANQSATSTPLQLKISNWSGGNVTLFSASSSFWETIFTTDDCNSACATATKNRIFDFMKMVVWLSTSLIILGMII